MHAPSRPTPKMTVSPPCPEDFTRSPNPPHPDFSFSFAPSLPEAKKGCPVLVQIWFAPFFWEWAQSRPQSSCLSRAYILFYSIAIEKKWITSQGHVVLVLLRQHADLDCVVQHRPWRFLFHSRWCWWGARFQFWTKYSLEWSWRPFWRKLLKFVNYLPY